MKTISIKVEICKHCKGKGVVKFYPYYVRVVKPMKKKIQCPNCNGTGKILVIPYGSAYRVETFEEIARSRKKHK